MEAVAARFRAGIGASAGAPGALQPVDSGCRGARRSFSVERRQLVGVQRLCSRKFLAQHSHRCSVLFR